MSTIRNLLSNGTLIRKMKIVVLIITLLSGAALGDNSDIVNPSKEYLPPSREYLPPLLPEYLQSPPDTSTYVQDPPENAALSALDNNFLGEVTYIPVQVVIETKSDTASRQYLPPLIDSATEKTIEFDRTTTQIVLNEDDNDASKSNYIQTRQFAESATTDFTTEADREGTTPSSIQTEATTAKGLYAEEYTEVTTNSELKEAVVSTTIPDTTVPVTTESIILTTEFASVDEVTTEDDVVISTTESIQTTTSSPSVESDNDSIATTSTSESILPKISDFVSVDVVNTESSTDDLEKVPTTEGTPTTTAPAPVDIFTTESEPLNTQVLSTTIPEYIQNAQIIQAASEESTSETNDSARSNDLEATSDIIISQNEISTSETLLLEDGYHYSIPSILFG